MAIYKKKAKPPHNHPELVSALAGYLDEKKSKARGKGVPDIFEQSQTYGNSLHVRVVWDHWEGIPHPERGPIILDAYRKQRGEREMLKITLVQGFTPEEKKRFHVGD